MKPNFKNARGAPSSLPPRRKKESKDKKFPRHNAAGGASTTTQHTVELTRAQQLEAKAARDAVLAALPKTSPLAAKKFVEAISLDVDVDAARQLLLSSKALTALPASIGVLCQQLRKLDVAGNDLTDLSALASLQHLSNLNVSRNPRLASLKGLSGTCLSVLNISFCAVESLAGLEHTAFTLRTFIANDSRLRFQSPIFRDASAGLLEDEEDQARGVGAMLAEMKAASEHLPASLRASVKPDTVAMRNYVVLATLRQCETVVLSRNTRLLHDFPSWSAETLLAACGEAPEQTALHASEESGDDSSSAEDASARKTARRGAHKKHNSTANADAPDSKALQKEEEEKGGSDVSANKELKHAVALAHPLSVFERLPRLKKLSLSGCELHCLPSRWFLPMVTELRLAQNHLTSLQPDGVILRSLHILDISNNLFLSVTTLRRCRFLEQLNVRGNPLVDDGVAQDKAAGLVQEQIRPAKGDDDDGATTAASVVGAAPISVQQRVVRLFPGLKLLDNQPLLSAEEMRAAHKRGRDAAAAVAHEKEPAAGQERESTPETVKSEGANTAETGDGDGAMILAAPAPSRGSKDAKSAVHSPPRKAPRVDPTLIAAEAEAKDVVVEPPPSVLKATHAPIVRRERVLLRPDATTTGQANRSGANAKAADWKQRQKKGSGGMTPPQTVPTVLGQAAVKKLLEQNRKANAW